MGINGLFESVVEERSKLHKKLLRNNALRNQHTTGSLHWFMMRRFSNSMLRYPQYKSIIQSHQRGILLKSQLIVLQLLTRNWDEHLFGHTDQRFQHLHLFHIHSRSRMLGIVAFLCYWIWHSLKFLYCTLTRTIFSSRSTFTSNRCYWSSEKSMLY